MAGFLRQIIAGPRAWHVESGLDLCYVTDNIIATSGPSGTYPKIVYRNPLSALIKHLDAKHGDQWAIFEFRAEGTGYSDAEVYNRIHHFPFPDHQPPPFAYIPQVMASMRYWLAGGGGAGAFGLDAIEDDKENKRVVVIHCKAGKGRTGTMSCSYLISEQGWSMDDALRRFTERRMRPGFGQGVSIPSQLRYVSYVDRWTKHGKKYIDRAIEVIEIRVWGLREGLQCAVKGYVEGGKVIRTFHAFTNAEEHILQEDVVDNIDSDGTAQSVCTARKVALRPTMPITLETSDCLVTFVKRSSRSSMMLVTAMVHTWFNAYFEGNGPEQDGNADLQGTFELDWSALDGLRGTAYRGIQAFSRLAVDWRVAPAHASDATLEAA